jgi:hypothetical protein
MDTSEFRGLWFIVSGEQVQIGDRVTTDLDVTSTGRIMRICPDNGLPVVHLLSGPLTGSERVMFPGQLIRKVVRQQ